MVPSVLFFEKAPFFVYLFRICGIIQHCAEYGLVACEHIGLAHRIQIDGSPHQPLSEAGIFTVDIFLRGFEIVSGGIYLLQGFQNALVSARLIIRNQAAPHQAVGPVVESSLAFAAVLFLYYVIILPPYERMVWAGKHAVHHSVQPCGGFAYQRGVAQLIPQPEGSVQPIGALLQKPSRAAQLAVSVILPGADIAPQPSVGKHLFVLIQMPGDSVRGVLRPVAEPSFRLDLPYVQGNEVNRRLYTVRTLAPHRCHQNGRGGYGFDFQHIDGCPPRIFQGGGFIVDC